MQCPSCGTNNNEYHCYCFQCGSPIKSEVSSDETHENKFEAPHPINDLSPAFFNINEQVPLRRYKKEKSKMRKQRIILGTFLWILLLGLLSMSILYGVTWAKRYYRSILSNNVQSPVKTPDIRTVEIDGNKFHKITFYGKEGDQFYIKELNKTYTVRNGLAEALVDDSLWIGSQPQSESNQISVHLTVNLLENGQVERKISIPSFNVDVPLSPITLISPKSLKVETTASSYLLQLKVMPGSSLQIGENDYSDLIDSSGNFQLNVPLEAKGENILPIQVATKNFRKNQLKVVFIRPAMDIKLSLDPTTPKKTEEARLVITGVTEKNTSITTDDPTIVDIKVDPNTGAFKFTINLNQYGKNIFTIMASKENKGQSRLTYEIERIPNKDEYTRKAWKMDYEKLIKQPDLFQNKIFLCNGKVDSIMNTDNVVLFLFNLGLDEKKLIAVEYTGSLSIEKDKSYRIYGDIHETYQQYPKLIARYIFPE